MLIRRTILKNDNVAPLNAHQNPLAYIIIIIIVRHPLKDRTTVPCSVSLNREIDPFYYT